MFPNLSVRLSTDLQRKKYIMSNCVDVSELRNFQIFDELSYNEEKIMKENEVIYEMKCGVIKGYHQSHQYADKIRDELMSDFKFQPRENILVKIATEIQKANTVSVHIRRGDYLSKSGLIVNQGICTMEYYDQAINYIRSIANRPVFYFFSNDMEWGRENFNIQDSVFIESSLFTEYADRYDMYLMSVCKHNIITNSTFSWWGAWLNQNPGKIVIAPKKWNNELYYKDICPNGWFRI